MQIAVSASDFHADGVIRPRILSEAEREVVSSMKCVHLTQQSELPKEVKPCFIQKNRFENVGPWLVCVLSTLDG